MTKDELLEILDELLDATRPPSRSEGMISSGSVQRIRLSGDDIWIALDLTLEIVRGTPASRIEIAFRELDDRRPKG